MSAPLALPRWAEAGLLPIVNVAAALVLSGLAVLAIGENPVAATASLLRGALGSAEGIGFTLYYATNFIFTGLAVALAYRAGLFNIGGEGQAYVAGLGATLVALSAPGLPLLLLLPLAMLGAAAAGALWAAIPGWLQAKRGSHVVITTIMFNWLATILMSWLLVNHLRAPQNMQPESAPFPDAAHMPTMQEMAAAFGVPLPTTPLNLSFLLALAAAGFVWLLLWRTKLGYEMRALGENVHAATTAGIRPARITIIAMALSGALAAGVAANEVMGVQHRLILDFPAGAGFVGVAVALMGRAHPAGVVLASLLFGLLYQGGTELAFDMPRISRDMIVVIQGLVVLFAGAMGEALKQPLARLIGAR